jgi:hypothetical protein
LEDFLLIEQEMRMMKMYENLMMLAEKGDVHFPMNHHNQLTCFSGILIGFLLVLGFDFGTMK